MPHGKRLGRQRGFTYMGVLFLLVLMGLGLAGAGQTWSLASQRARERQLLWVGTQYARAIRSYYDSTPGVKQYPSSFDDLVEDGRFAQPKHHLREMYVDPITHEGFATILSPDGRIAGVHSRSDDLPIKQAEFPQRWAEFKDMTHYSDWLFKATEPVKQPSKIASPGGNAPLPTTIRQRPPGS